MPARPPAPSPSLLPQATALPNGEGQQGKLHGPVRSRSPAKNKVKQQPEAGWWLSRGKAAVATVSLGFLRLLRVGLMGPAESPGFPREGAFMVHKERVTRSHGAGQVAACQALHFCFSLTSVYLRWPPVRREARGSILPLLLGSGGLSTRPSAGSERQGPALQVGSAESGFDRWLLGARCRASPARPFVPVLSLLPRLPGRLRAMGAVRGEEEEGRSQPLPLGSDSPCVLPAGLPAALVAELRPQLGLRDELGTRRGGGEIASPCSAPVTAPLAWAAVTPEPVAQRPQWG